MGNGKTDTVEWDSSKVTKKCIFVWICRAKALLVLKQPYKTPGLESVNLHGVELSLALFSALSTHQDDSSIDLQCIVGKAVRLFIQKYYYQRTYA